MKGLTLTTKEQTRLQVLNGVLARLWPAAQGAEILGVSERHVWRLVFHLAEVAVPLEVFRKVLERGSRLLPPQW